MKLLNLESYPEFLHLLVRNGVVSGDVFNDPELMEKVMNAHMEIVAALPKYEVRETGLGTS